MPDYKAEFDAMFSYLAMPDPSESDPLAKQLRAAHLGRWTTLIKEHRDNRGPNMPSIYYEYVENPLLNLYANYSRASHCGYVAICSGAVPIIFDLFYRLLSNPKVLPEISNVVAESDRSPLGLLIDYRAIVANRPTSRRSLSDVAPLDPGRKRYAESLAGISLAFLIHHELAHVTLGHCEYVMQGGTPLMELSSTSPSTGNLARQALEIGADCAAAVTTYIRVLATPTESEKAARAMLETGSQLVVPDHLIVFDWVFAMYIMFWTFGQDIDLNRLDTATHPPPARRATRAFNCVYGFLKRQVGEDARIRMMKECERAIDAGAFALEQITGGAAVAKLIKYQILEENGTMAQHFQRIADKWQEIKGDVEKYKHGVM